jgi:transcriptional regulator with XRE-family HTH domain
MDKKKTGNLIREARQCKNYTQSELGRMLGVTNKAVSRWENGESFPDIGVLESLSHLLELPIQDIVTGERAGDREEAVTEVVRLAKLQEQRKREKRILYLIVLGLLIYHCVIGIDEWGFKGVTITDSVKGDKSVYAVACLVAGISMAGTLTMLGLVYRYFGKEEDVKMIPSSQLSRGLGIASLAMLLWSVGIMYLSFGMVRAGSVPLGMELSSLGPFLNNQLCAGYALNVIFLAVEMYRLLMERTVLHPGCVISPAVIYLDFFYIDILGRMDTLDSVWKALDRGTVLILLEAVLGIVFLFIQSHRSRSHASDSPHQSQ